MRQRDRKKRDHEKYNKSNFNKKIFLPSKEKFCRFPSCYMVHGKRLLQQVVRIWFPEEYGQDSKLRVPGEREKEKKGINKSSDIKLK